MKTIFVPSDLSTHSHNALRYAVELAHLTGVGEIFLFHHNPQVYTGDIPVLYMEDLSKINEELKEHLEKEAASILAKSSKPKSSLKMSVLVSTEAGTISAISDHAEKVRADLIVMGSHGKTGLTRLVFGSVTAGVMEVSPVPVLAIPEGYRFNPPANILFASSLNHFQKELHKLKHLIGFLPSAISVVHMRYPHFDEELISRAKHLLKEEGEERIQLDVVETKPEVRLVDQLLVYTRKKAPDWLVMFPEKRDWYEKLFLSSKTLELLSHFRRPLLVMHR